MPPTGVPVETVLVEVAVDEVVPGPVVLLLVVVPVIPKNARSIVSCTGTVCPTPFPIFLVRSEDSPKLKTYPQRNTR